MFGDNKQAFYSIKLRKPMLKTKQNKKNICYKLQLLRRRNQKVN